MVPSSVEQKLRLPLPEIGRPAEKYWPAGLEPIAVEVKVYPLFVPAARRESMRQAPLESGALQFVPPRLAKAGAKPTVGKLSL